MEDPFFILFDLDIEAPNSGEFIKEKNYKEITKYITKTFEHRHLFNFSPLDYLNQIPNKKRLKDVQLTAIRLDNKKSQIICRNAKSVEKTQKIPKFYGDRPYFELSHNEACDTDKWGEFIEILLKSNRAIRFSENDENNVIEYIYERYLRVVFAAANKIEVFEPFFHDSNAMRVWEGLIQRINDDYDEEWHSLESKKEIVIYTPHGPCKERAMYKFCRDEWKRIFYEWMEKMNNITHAGISVKIHYLKDKIDPRKVHDRNIYLNGCLDVNLPHGHVFANAEQDNVLDRQASISLLKNDHDKYFAENRRGRYFALEEETLKQP